VSQKVQLFITVAARTSYPTNIENFLNAISRVVFVTETQCGFCNAGIEILNSTWINFRIKNIHLILWHRGTGTVVLVPGYR
jgi:hypothetical protein